MHDHNKVKRDLAELTNLEIRGLKKEVAKLRKKSAKQQKRIKALEDWRARKSIADSSF